MSDELSGDGNLAPVLLFVYNRPEHTKQTVEALKNNELAPFSDLIIYSDAGRTEKDQAKVLLVRDYLRTITGFKTISVVERDVNKGLADNIIDGVTKVINLYGKVIVLEDDILTSSAFLNFMNQALVRYQDNERIWHISSWNYPIIMDEESDAFFWRVMNCWGWATWKDKWQHFEKNPREIIRSWTEAEKRRFDLDNSGIFWSQIKGNAKQKMDTWAIFWYATIFKRQGLCLNPTESYTANIGHDGSGVHCGNDKTANQKSVKLCDKTELSWPITIAESQNALNQIKSYYKKRRKSIVVRAMNKISRSILNRNIFS